MKVTQIYEIMNTVTKEILGSTELVTEDLSNIVDLGTQILDSSQIDNYVNKLVNHIGKVIFTNRQYKGSVPSVLMDAWEFGSVVEKITTDIPEARENDTWALKDGETYSQDVFYQPKVSAKFFNSKVCFEVPISFTTTQVKESFSNLTQLNAFLSMIESSVEKSITIKLDSLIMRTINNMTALTLGNEFGTGKKGKEVVTDFSTSGTKAVNLLKLYNDKTGSTLTPVQCLTDKEFVRFATYCISLHMDRVSKISKLFNIGAKERFTPKEMLHVVMLSDFAKSSEIYLQSDTFHKDLVELKNFDTVPYWQGSGTKFDFASTSQINVDTKKYTINCGGILAVMFDRDALGVSNLNNRVTTNWNAKAEFYNNYYKVDAGYFNDENENFIVFFVA